MRWQRKALDACKWDARKPVEKSAGNTPNVNNQERIAHKTMAKMKNGECKRTKKGRKYCMRGGKVRFVKG